MMSLHVYRKASTTPVYVGLRQMSLPVYRKPPQHQFMLAYARCLCLFTGKHPQHQFMLAYERCLCLFTGKPLQHQLKLAYARCLCLFTGKPSPGRGNRRDHNHRQSSVRQRISRRQVAPFSLPFCLMCIGHVYVRPYSGKNNQYLLQKKNNYCQAH